MLEALAGPPSESQAWEDIACEDVVPRFLIRRAVSCPSLATLLYWYVVAPHPVRPVTSLVDGEFPVSYRGRNRRG